MADKTGEQLSALVDCECEMPELELAVRRLIKDPDLKARWQRYHLISDALKNNLPAVIDTDFSNRVSQAIDTAPPLQTTTIRAVSSWYKPLTGFALAASVALIAVFGLNLIERRATTIDPDPVIAATSPPGLQTVDAPPESTQPTSDTRIRVAGSNALEARLNSYLVNHNEYASMNSVYGVLPYVRMVGHETNRR